MVSKVLDHGYVQLVESWGSDERVIESARMSTQKGFLGWGTECKHCYGRGKHTIDYSAVQSESIVCSECNGEPYKPGDEKLLRFLWENKHHTPFEMAGMMIEVQAPIMVFREWHRHRTQSYNEMSGRYVVLPNMFYIPDLERLQNSKQAVKNKQSSEAGFTTHQADILQGQLMMAYENSRQVYEDLIRQNVAKEVARLVLPVAQYSKMRAAATLRNWLQFLTLRMEQGAQWEIRQYANVVGEMIQQRFPRTYELFQEGMA